MTITKEIIAAEYKRIQDDICRGLEGLDGVAVFEEENWERDGGGGGRTRIIQQGGVIQRGGVNFSAVHGRLPDAVKRAFGVDEENFFATGVSIVLHPKNPFVPIIHMNIRYFELNDKVRWFGGGIDLTPHYINRQEARFFHQSLKDVCDAFNPTFYADFKHRADHYFYIKHRQETRGIGGIFYDRLTPEKAGIGWDRIFDFSCGVGNAFVPIYSTLANQNRDHAFTPAHEQWQYLRRGRYVEFNLVYDAGTKFGLETNGRIESILMSLPPEAQWAYNFVPEAGSPEADTLSLLKPGIDWLAT